MLFTDNWYAWHADPIRPLLPPGGSRLGYVGVNEAKVLERQGGVKKPFPLKVLLGTSFEKLVKLLDFGLVVVLKIDNFFNWKKNHFCLVIL